MQRVTKKHGIIKYYHIRIDALVFLIFLAIIIAVTKDVALTAISNPFVESLTVGMAVSVAFILILFSFLRGLTPVIIDSNKAIISYGTGRFSAVSISHANLGETSNAGYIESNSNYITLVFKDGTAKKFGPIFKRRQDAEAVLASMHELLKIDIILPPSSKQVLNTIASQIQQARTGANEQSQDPMILPTMAILLSFVGLFLPIIGMGLGVYAIILTIQQRKSKNSTLNNIALFLAILTILISLMLTALLFLPYVIRVIK